MQKTLLVTGGAGFIGSNLIFAALKNTDWKVVNVDKLSYSSNIQTLAPVENNPRYSFIKADIVKQGQMDEIFAACKPDMVMHLAAESHVDRSIDDPSPFIVSNIMGTFSLLEATRKYWKALRRNNPAKAEAFRFHHISTDEVFGDLSGNGDEGAFFSEETAYCPSSPYSASKASSDHLVRAWQRTYGLPCLITNCSNNYGPYQFPEKLIPLVIINALAGKKLPVYGEGLQIRDWLHVEDHAGALLLAIQRGIPGETYVIGGHNERTNIDVVKSICAIMEELVPDKPKNIKDFCGLITYVQDRPGHDGRYAIDPAKITDKLGWKPVYNFDTGLKQTVKWYLDNRDWWQPIQERYQGQRLGLTDE